jgi:branched-chain amino acid transport system substrate-binding protein
MRFANYIIMLMLVVSPISGCSAQSEAPISLSEIKDVPYNARKSNFHSSVTKNKLADILENPNEQFPPQPRRNDHTEAKIASGFKSAAKEKVAHKTVVVDESLPASMRNVTPKFIEGPAPKAPKAKPVRKLVSAMIPGYIPRKPVFTQRPTEVVVAQKTITEAPVVAALAEEVEVVTTPAKPKVYNVALLLPLSGTKKELGTSLLNASELALFNLGTKNIVIKNYDTKGSEDGAKKAINKALLDNVDVVLGPMFSKTTRAIAEIAKNNNTPLISFSNDSSLANDNNIVFGFLPETQIQRLTDYSLKQGITKFSGLLPQNGYGKLIEHTLIKELNKKQLKIERAGWYKTADERLSRTIKNITVLPEDVTPEQLRPRSEILFVPESGPILNSIISRLASKNVNSKRFRFAGISDWKSPKIHKNKRLIGSWFAAPNIAERDNFNAVFKDTFDYEPAAIASLSYDALALLSLITEDANNNKLTFKSFNNATLYEGISGQFYINHLGLVQRKLNMYQIDNSTITLID